MNLKSLIFLPLLCFFSLVSYASPIASSLQQAAIAVNKKEWKKAYELALPLAQRGNSQAQRYVSFLHYKGLGVKQDNELALMWLNEAIERNDPIAFLDWGIMFLEGKAVKRNEEQAIKLFTKSFELGNSQAAYNLAILYNKKDSKKTLFYLEKAAMANHREAQYQLARAYSKLNGKVNLELTEYWYNRAAIGGYPVAQMALAKFYVTRAELNQAEYWYTQLANKGNLEAQYQLYSMHLKTDHNKSFYWLSKAAQNGYSLAEYDLGTMYYQGQLLVGQNFKLAEFWLSRAAEKNNPKAQYNLALMYEHGFGVDKDIQKALQLYRLSKEQNNAEVILKAEEKIAYLEKKK